MTLIAEHVESDTRERILVVAERLFREIGYQKTTVADIAKVLRMSPANVYRFFDSKKAIHEGVARSLMGEVEIEAQASHAAADVMFRTLFSLPIEDRAALAVFEAFRAHQRTQPILNLAAFVPGSRWMPRFHSRRTKATAATRAA